MGPVVQSAHRFVQHCSGVLSVPLTTDSAREEVICQCCDVRCMTECPPTRCGYPWEVRDPHASCCYREIWGTRDRCIWHADVGKDVEKPIEELQNQRETETNRRLNRGELGDRPAELLDGIQLNGVDLGDSLSFASCNLRDADLSGANLGGANLSKASLMNTDLSGAHLQEAALRGAKMWLTRLPGAKLWAANLSGVDMLGTDLSESNLIDANLSGAKIRRLHLANTNLQNANLQNSLVRNLDLSDADLNGADFSEAEIHNANLEGATTRNVILPESYSGSDLGRTPKHDEPFITADQLKDWLGAAATYRLLQFLFGEGDSPHRNPGREETDDEESDEIPTETANVPSTRLQKAMHYLGRASQAGTHKLVRLWGTIRRKVEVISLGSTDEEPDDESLGDSSES